MILLLLPLLPCPSTSFNRTVLLGWSGKSGGWKEEQKLDPSSPPLGRERHQREHGEKNFPSFERGRGRMSNFKLCCGWPSHWMPPKPHEIEDGGRSKKFKIAQIWWLKSYSSHWEGGAIAWIFLKGNNDSSKQFQGSLLLSFSPCGNIFQFPSIHRLLYLPLGERGACVRT